MRHAVLAASLAACSLLLSACGERSGHGTAERPAADPETEAETAVATGIDGLSVANARLVMPAVTGNPAGVFFDLSYAGAEPLVLESVAVSGSASADLHDVAGKDGMMQMVPLVQTRLARGGTLSFAPGGKHVMAMEFDSTVAPGGTVEVSLTFAGGQTARFSAEVLPAGSAAMDH